MRDYSAKWRELGQALVLRNETLGIVECGSGGSICAQATAVSGSSAWLAGGLVPYANALKHQWLNWPVSRWLEHGVASEAAVADMLPLAQRVLLSDWVLVESGIYGPNGGCPERPAGLVYLGVAGKESSQIRSLRRHGSRESMRTDVALLSAEFLLQMIME